MSDNEVTDRKSVWRELAGGTRTRWAQRVAILRMLPRGGPLILGSVLTAQVAAGLLPLGFLLMTSRVVAGVPDAVRDGTASAAWHQLRTELIIAATFFFAIQILVPVQAFLGSALQRRIDGGIRDRFMADACRASGIAVLNDAELLDQASDGLSMLQMNYWSPGYACAGLVALLSRYLQAVSGAVVIGVVYTPWAGAAVLAAGLVIRVGYRAGLSAFGVVYRSIQRVRRRKLYFRDLLLNSAAAKEIRIFGLLGWLATRYESAYMDNIRPVWKHRRRVFYGPYVLYALTAVALLTAALAASAAAAAEAELSIGAFILLVQAALSSIRIGGFIADSDMQTEYGMSADRALRRFGELTGRAASAEPGNTVAPADLPVREIRFEDVTFRYAPGTPPVLEHLNLTIETGRSLAVVGLNGAGKSTLVMLLARFHSPESGRITADGIDINTFSGVSWQRKVAAIFQDFTRYELPVRENVGFGSSGVHDDAAIEAALDRAGALDFVRSLPLGLDTPLAGQYAGGTDLSGGQWQRIAMARALIAVDGGARILVLDEPTAALDARAEVAFFDRYIELTRGTTSLVISHRFSTVRRADHIAVLSDGAISEHGTHDELMALGGRYAELFLLQAARFSDDEHAETPGVAAGHSGGQADA